MHKQGDAGDEHAHIKPAVKALHSLLAFTPMLPHLGLCMLHQLAQLWARLSLHVFLVISVEHE